MLKDKFAFIDEATTTAIRNEQDELRMHGATRTLQTLCSSLPSGINAERERFRKIQKDADAAIAIRRKKYVQKDEKPGQIKTDACRGFGTVAGT